MNKPFFRWKRLKNRNLMKENNKINTLASNHDPYLKCVQFFTILVTL